MVDTPAGETATPKPLENTNNTPSTPPVVKATDEEVERARKETEQARMRSNQLENELKALKDAQAAQQAKELEEQNKFKELYEQEQAKREALENERTLETQEASRTTAQKAVLTEFSEDVQALAEDAGITLENDSPEAQTAFKEKLAKIEKRVSGEVTPNNPGTPGEAPLPSGPELADKIRTQDGFDEAMSKMKYLGEMTKPQQ